MSPEEQAAVEGTGRGIQAVSILGISVQITVAILMQSSSSYVWDMVNTL
jgi:hypothetical protein